MSSTTTGKNAGLVEKDPNKKIVSHLGKRRTGKRGHCEMNGQWDELGRRMKTGRRGKQESGKNKTQRSGKKTFVKPTHGYRRNRVINTKFRRGGGPRTDFRTQHDQRELTRKRGSSHFMLELK